VVGPFPSDDVLGPVAWDSEYRWWTFDAGAPGGPPLRGKIIPEVEGALPSAEWLRLIRECLVWVRANEPQLRRRVAEDMFDYWCQTYRDDEDEVDTPEAFAAAITTTAVNFSEGGQAEVFYDDAGLFGNHGIWVEVNAGGEFVRGPDFC
jgi:hypothetical protein